MLLLGFVWWFSTIRSVNPTMKRYRTELMKTHRDISSHYSHSLEYINHLKISILISVELHSLCSVRRFLVRTKSKITWLGTSQAGFKADHVFKLGHTINKWGCYSQAKQPSGYSQRVIAHIEIIIQTMASLQPLSRPTQNLKIVEFN